MCEIVIKNQPKSFYKMSLMKSSYILQEILGTIQLGP